ncbi:YjbF family lipoprotein [Sulfitobacter guttiformis]|uniref:Group 4 capsule polysaccharide lipoprotein GfcB/YjbF n=1 Tax=Sulfitobacter guttiformis TaxID=74349 RepID=A0A420DRY1_9RHOB|nr:YjbF family lipoprotein [Sulfitobacter guttiformis]KIN74313.1 DUF2886 domain containing protein [Sulfitobacter guttiformis KCTC 32187]RKE96913.1 group 4 capsule polysaccharide lipoprotein GfcB/YjbF [Sulfitobacter guttiformis]
MIKMFSRIVGAGVIAVILAACSSDQNSQASLPKLVFGSLVQTVNQRRAGPVQQIVPTQQQLDETNEPVLQINPEISGGSDFLRLRSSRRDSGLGVVQVWYSSDNAQIFLRDGVLIGTRGVGGDIISADADMTIKALRAQSQGTGVRTYVISDGDVTSTDYSFNCTVKSLGSENISVVNQVFITDRFRETCVGGPNGDAVLNNEYWVQPSNGLIRKSRQWVGPRVGYFEIIVLKN